MIALCLLYLIPLLTTLQLQILLNVKTLGNVNLCLLSYLIDAS